MHQTEAFKQRIDLALANQQTRDNCRKAMSDLMDKRAESLCDEDELNALRDQCSAIRAHSVSHLPELLVMLETRMTENGIQVHWAESAEQANEVIYDLLNKASVSSVVKGKSMVSEETELNQYLEERDIEIVESDLGEFIIQLAKEMPSHIIMPAIHKNKEEVAELFHKHFPDIDFKENVEDMTALARQVLREKFARAGAGISGVNFAVAETGTICLVENEGNGRLSTTAPDIHIAITGIEKVVRQLSDVPPLVNLLTRTAIGQPITTYFNMISSPRKDDQKDGPKEVHIVLLDNGRSKIREDADLQDTLRCIRCGTCINHCPVYVQTGGHAYGTVYPGPIGIVLEPQRLGIQQIGALTSACSLCGACGDVCPVKIPLPKLINRLRAESVNASYSEALLQGKGSLRKNKEQIIWAVWKTLYGHATLYKTFRWFATRLGFLTPPKLGGWTKYRTSPKPATQSLSDLAKKEGFKHE